MRSTRRLRLLVLGLLICASTLALPKARASGTSLPLKGISYAAWWSDQYSTPEADASLRQLASTGANWISLIVTGHQASATDTTIDWYDPSTPADADLVHVMRLAHQLGLRVMLKPHVDLPNERVTGIWRGHIGTGFTSEAQWSAWFSSYRAFIEHYARLAQDNAADQFSVGCELLGTTQRESDWRDVVAGVRAIYHGPLVYAALHGGEETSITWWDALDYIGVDAYYSLTDTSWVESATDLTIEQLREAWQAPMSILAGLSARFGKPILLTEIGYRSSHGCTNHPWDSWLTTDVDLQEQARAYQAAFESLSNQPWLAGMFWWTWYADRYKSGICDDSFSPHEKPAEDVLRAWYGGEPLPSLPQLWPDPGHTLDIYGDGLLGEWQDWSWNATINQVATEQVHTGAHSMAITLAPWGALSLWHLSFRADQYHWLEFTVRASSSLEPRLVVYWRGPDGGDLLRVPVNDCRSIESGRIDPGEWKTVRIPLSDLQADAADLQRLVIQDASGQGTAMFWIDDLRLVAAVAPAQSILQIYLPVVQRHS